MVDSLVHAHGILPNGYLLNAMSSDGKTMTPLIGLNASNQAQVCAPLCLTGQTLSSTALLGTLLLPSGSMLLPVTVGGVTYNLILVKA